MRIRLMIVAAVAVALAGVGCSSDDGAPNESAPPESASSESAEQAEDSGTDDAEASGGDFCEMYATRVAQGLQNMAELDLSDAEGVAAAESKASELAAEAPVSQAEIEAVAPPEPRGYLEALSNADAAGANGDMSAMNDLGIAIVQLNDWAIANCDAEYRPVLAEYKEIIG